MDVEVEGLEVVVGIGYVVGDGQVGLAEVLGDVVDSLVDIEQVLDLVMVQH